MKNNDSTASDNQAKESDAVPLGDTAPEATSTEGIHNKEEKSQKTEKPDRADKKQPHKDKNTKKISKVNRWTIEITIITFFLSCFFSFVSEVSSAKANLIIASLLLLFLITLSIAFDAIGVAVTSCELSPLLSCASRRIPGSKTAVKLVKNAEKVANICADVIGDICGIVSGACTIAIVVKIQAWIPDINVMVVAIALSGVVAALTVGGKAYMKSIAMKNSTDLIMFVARLLDIFKKKPRKEQKQKKK